MSAKLLCLHGYTQNAQIFSKKIAAVRKACKHVEFVFIDAPHTVHMPTEVDATREELDSAPLTSQDEEEKPRAWWIAGDLADGTKHYRGFDESLKLLFNVLSTQKFDGVLGFSQGAAMAGILMLLLQNPSLIPSSIPKIDQLHPPFEYSILCAGFKSVDPRHAQFWRTKVSGRVLHVLGKNDAIVAEDRTRPFVEAFQDPRVEIHDGGHVVPAKALWRTFFDQYTASQGGKKFDVASPSSEAFKL